MVESDSLTHSAVASASSVNAAQLRIQTLPVRVGEANEQRSIGFQPVPRDHWVWPSEIGKPCGVSQIGAERRLEAYAMLLLRFAKEFCKVVLGHSKMEEL